MKKLALFNNPFKKKDSFADLNMGGNDLQSSSGLDTSLDINSGLDLEGLNNDSSGMQGVSSNQNEQFDSFGNKKSKNAYLSPDFGLNPSQTNISQNNSSGSIPADLSKDMQIVIAKLDAIKSEVASLNHRLEMIERRQNSPTNEKKYLW